MKSKAGILSAVLLLVFTANSDAQLQNYLSKTHRQLLSSPGKSFRADSLIFLNAIISDSIIKYIANSSFSSCNYATLQSAKTAAVASRAPLVVPADCPTGTLSFTDADSALILINYNTITIAASDTIPAGAEIYCIGNGRLSLSSGVTLRINGFFDAPANQVFTGAGVVRFGTGSTTDLYTEWWGAKADSSTNCSTAFQKAIDAASHYSTVRLLPTRSAYLTSGTITLPSHQDNRQITWNGQGAKICYNGTGTLFYVYGDTGNTANPSAGPRATEGPRHIIENVRLVKVGATLGLGNAVVLQSVVHQTVRDFQIESFKYGIQFLNPSGKNNQWTESCTILNGRIRKCKYGIAYRSLNPAGTNTNSFRDNHIVYVSVSGTNAHATSLTDTTYALFLTDSASVYDNVWTKLNISISKRSIGARIGGRIAGTVGTIEMENVGKNDSGAVYWFFSKYSKNIWCNIDWNLVGRKQGKAFYIDSSTVTTVEGPFTADAGTGTDRIKDAGLPTHVEDFYAGATVINTTRVDTATVVSFDSTNEILYLDVAIPSQTTGDSYTITRNVPPNYNSWSGLTSQLPVSSAKYGPDTTKDTYRGESWLLRPNTFSRIRSFIQVQQDTLSNVRFVEDVTGAGQVFWRIRRATPIKVLDTGDGKLASIQHIDIGSTRVVNDSTALDARSMTNLRHGSNTATIDSLKTFTGGKVGQTITVLFLDDSVAVANLSGASGSGRLFLRDNVSIRSIQGQRSFFICESESGGTVWREFYRHYQQQDNTITSTTGSVDISQRLVIRLNFSTVDTVTNFINGNQSQPLYVVHVNGNGTITNNSNIAMSDGASFTGYAGVTHLFLYDRAATIWREVSRSYGGSILGGSQTKTLTEASATNFVQIAVSSGSFVGGRVEYTVHANDATDFQNRTGSFNFSVVNKAGTETATIGTVINEAFAESAGASTLTVSFTADTSPANAVNLQANASSSLTQTTLAIKYRVVIHSGTATITPQ